VGDQTVPIPYRFTKAVVRQRVRIRNDPGRQLSGGRDRSRAGRAAAAGAAAVEVGDADSVAGGGAGRFTARTTMLTAIDAAMISANVGACIADPSAAPSSRLTKVPRRCLYRLKFI
jgi:hypothetical protein